MQPGSTKETDMADRRPISDTGDDSGAPRWVKVSGIIAIAVVLLLVIVLVVGGGHGPGGH
jgi:hypothetical protein